MGNPIFRCDSNEQRTRHSPSKCIMKLIDQVKLLEPVRIHEYLESLFIEMDPDAKQAVLQILFRSLNEIEKPDFLMMAAEGDRNYNNDEISKLLSFFSEYSQYNEVVEEIDDGGSARNYIEDQIMQILGQVLNHAERTNISLHQ